MKERKKGKSKKKFALFLFCEWEEISIKKIFLRSHDFLIKNKKNKGKNHHKK